jgi:hypothetical protein
MWVKGDLGLRSENQALAAWQVMNAPKVLEGAASAGKPLGRVERCRNVWAFVFMSLLQHHGFVLDIVSSNIGFIPTAAL